MYNTPILFLIFNRPDTTQIVFDRIREIKPSRLYVGADGPRENKVGELEKCETTRNVISQIDWDCKVYTLFRNENLGCKIAVSEAITWFFQQEEYGIILEDDCLPDLSFFPYCEELLIKYKDDDRIGHISGNSFLPPSTINNDRDGDSYSFSLRTHIWGWATWRRVWNNYDVNFPFWKNTEKKLQLRGNVFINVWEKIYFSSFISDTLNNANKISTWDVQYVFLLRLQNQLSIYPHINLVTNIGIDAEGATHTSTNSQRLIVPSLTMKFPLIHPTYMMHDKVFDNQLKHLGFFSWKRLLRYGLKKIGVC